jgi:hypothetical protein
MKHDFATLNSTIQETREWKGMATVGVENPEISILDFSASSGQESIANIPLNRTMVPIDLSEIAPLLIEHELSQVPDDMEGPPIGSC